MTPGMALTAWARLIIETLAQAGIKEAVISPGSRSTPFTAAVLASSLFRTWRVIDERSAGFFGLGLARSLQRPVLLICTSGTAAANYFPAIMEANLSKTPLIILTADRPVELQYCRAPQTADQVGLYGNQVRRFVELGAPETDPTIWRKMRRLVVSTVHFAQHPVPGPVHLEVRARKPLEPILPISQQDIALWQELERVLAEPAAMGVVTTGGAAGGDFSRMERDCISREKGIISLGYDPEFPIIDFQVLNHFSAITGYPIFLDVAHPLRFQVIRQSASAVVGHYDVLGRIKFLHENQPELIIHLGAPLTSGAWEQWMDRASERGVVIHAITRDGWPDPSGSAATVTMGNPTEIIRELSRRITKILSENKSRKNSWITKWQKADELVRQKIAEVSQSIEFGEGASVFTAVQTCPPESQLVLGNSLPIREVDFWCGAESRKITTYAIRGGNGIDGMISVAAGIAEGAKKKTMLLMGDISFLHDIGGLLVASQVKTTLVLLVINNGGGRIFDHLPVGQMIKSPELDWWTTPHSMQFAHIAAQFGIVYKMIYGKNELIQELEQAWNYSGVSLVEVLVNSRSADEQIKKVQCAVKESIHLL